MQWLTDRWILVGNYVLDQQQGCAIWGYEGARICSGSPDGRLWYLKQNGSSNPTTLGAFMAPLPAVRHLSDASGEIQVKPAVGPGVRVSIKADLSDKARRSLLKRMEKAGIEVVDKNAAVRLVSSVKSKSLGSAEYEELGSGKKHTVSEQRITRRIAWETADGKTLWSQSSVAQDLRRGNGAPPRR